MKYYKSAIQETPVSMFLLIFKARINFIPLKFRECNVEFKARIWAKLKVKKNFGITDPGNLCFDILFNF